MGQRLARPARASARDRGLRASLVEKGPLASEAGGEKGPRSPSRDQEVGVVCRAQTPAVPAQPWPLEGIWNVLEAAALRDGAGSWEPTAWTVPWATEENTRPTCCLAPFTDKEARPSE